MEGSLEVPRNRARRGELLKIESAGCPSARRVEVSRVAEDRGVSRSLTSDFRANLIGVRGEFRLRGYNGGPFATHQPR
jgi:hypothetical protein